MNVLAIHTGHNASALLMLDGRVAGAVSQERFNDIKNASGFPSDAVAWLLKRQDLANRQIDHVCFCGADGVEQHAAQAFLDKLNVRADKITTIDHHTCHAYAPVSFYPKVTSPWLVFTANNEGDGLSSTVNIWDGHQIRRITETPAESSLGHLYSGGTAFLGMNPLEHEHKVMGLATYAKESSFVEVYNRLFRNVISFDPVNPLVFRSTFPLTETFEYLKKHAVGIRFDVLAAALQHCLEQHVLQWVRNAIRLTGITQIMTGGGVFMNVKLNKLIREMPEVTGVRFMPSSGAETNPFGATFVLCRENGIEPEPVHTLYLGPAYSNEDLEGFLKSHPERDRYSLTFCPDIEAIVADALANRHIVARFAGRAEFGARSLGNRAILAHPSDMKSFFEVNEKIKGRDFWMPFAPTILDTHALRYLHCPDDMGAGFMIDAFDTTEEGRLALCAAMHQGDKSVRPQILKREANPDYYRLIEGFKNKTGVGALLNTSFNLHGYPMATTPEQAVFTFLNSGLRFMAMESWMVTKKA